MVNDLSLNKVLITNKQANWLPFKYSSLVVPTNRVNSVIEFMSKWANSFKDNLNSIHIIFDGHSSNFPENYVKSIKSYNSNAHVHSWDKLFLYEQVDSNVINQLPDTIENLEINGTICFSKKDSAIRSYGFLLSAAFARATTSNSLTLDDHVIYSLDDDCMPIYISDSYQTDFFAKHSKNLLSFPAWGSTVPGIRVRGLPYYTHDSIASISKDVLMSIGTWSGVPDFDAAQRLLIGHEAERTEIPLLHESVMAHPNIVYPICGMNMAFKASMLPAALFAPMGTCSKYKRFDDIWFGLFAQAVLYVSKKHWCFGQPLIHHTRLSGAMDCLVAEAPGIRLNESLWMYIKDSIDNYILCGHKLESSSILEAAHYVTRAMSYYKDTAHAVFNKYSKDCTDYVELWCECLNNWLSLVDRYVITGVSLAAL